MKTLNERHHHKRNRRKEIEALGMPLTQLSYKSCTAEFGVGKDFATLYSIRSKEEGKGHATYLLTQAKKYYEGQGKKFGSKISLSGRMERLLKKLGIEEYGE